MCAVPLGDPSRRGSGYVVSRRKREKPEKRQVPDHTRSLLRGSRVVPALIHGSRRTSSAVPVGRLVRTANAKPGLHIAQPQQMEVESTRKLPCQSEASDHPPKTQ